MCSVFPVPLVLTGKPVAGFGSVHFLVKGGPARADLQFDSELVSRAL